MNCTKTKKLLELKKIIEKNNYILISKKYECENVWIQCSKHGIKKKVHHILEKSAFVQNALMNH